MMLTYIKWMRYVPVKFIIDVRGPHFFNHLTAIRIFCFKFILSISEYQQNNYSMRSDVDKLKSYNIIKSFICDKIVLT